MCYKHRFNILALLSLTPLFLGCGYSTISTNQTPLPISTSITTEVSQNTCINPNISVSFASGTDWGTIVFRESVNLAMDNLIFFEPDKDEETRISNQYVDMYATSPLGTYLAFNSLQISGETTKSHLIVLNASGDQVAVFEEDTWRRFDWLNEKVLLIDLVSSNNSLLAVNFISGEKELLEPFSSNRWFGHEVIYSWGFYAYHKTIYNNDTTRILYPSIIDNEPNLVMKNTETNEDLGLYPIYEAWGVSPKWTSDGTKIAVALNTNSSFFIDGKSKYEIFIIGRDGEMLFSTNLTKFSEELYIPNLSWSPNGKYIAFWYTTKENDHEGLELAVLDITSKAIKTFCITKNEETYQWKRNDVSPIWSPDSSSVLVEVTDNDIAKAVVVNIINEEILLTKSNVIPVGWMK